MADIFQFPTKSVRDSASIERTIREYFREHMNASPEMVTEICERMKEFWNKTQRPLGEPSFKLPYVEYLDAAKREALEKAISNFVRSIEYDVHELMAEIMSERLRLEIELYRLRLKK